MATYIKRKDAQGRTRWTCRVRIRGREAVKTFSTKGKASSWARVQETAIESGAFIAADPRDGFIFADLVDDFLAHRRRIKRPLASSSLNTIARLKDEHGLEPASTLTAAFWRRHVLDRMAEGVASQTGVGELAYAASILAHAKREGKVQDAGGPAEARAHVADEGLRTSSRVRDRRISDDELATLIEKCDTINSGVPLGALVRFALATSMRRGEILRLQRADVRESERVAIVRNRKHPRDHDRVDEVPLMPLHPVWPRWDALEIIKAQPKGTLVFPYLGDTLGERFEHACKAAGLTGVVFHLLRHESLSRYAERGFDPLRLQLIGGHRDLKHVARYAKLTARGLTREATPAPADSGKADTTRDTARAAS